MAKALTVDLASGWRGTGNKTKGKGAALRLISNKGTWGNNTYGFSYGDTFRLFKIIYRRRWTARANKA
jgi:hypothetical protein